MSEFLLKIAETEAEVNAAKRLRYRVFADELGAVGSSIDAEKGLDEDRFDAVADHLLLIDCDASENEGVVGTYRLLSDQAARSAGGFYSAHEFDLAPLQQHGHRLLELGRSCLHPDYRGGTAMHELWSALADYVTQGGYELLFGVASFHGTDVAELREPLGFLHRNHLAPVAMRVTAKGEAARTLDPWPERMIERRSATAAIPALVKGYLRLGGTVGDGAWVDHSFNTTDVCMILDCAKIAPRQRAIYARGRGLR